MSPSHLPRTTNCLTRWLLFVFSLLLLAACRAQDLADLSNPPASVRVLLITEENRLFQHHIQVVQGAAQGYPQRVGQWMAVVLDENRQPLADFGIPDPRLTLEHRPDGALWLPIDSTTSYLFDIVVPLSYEPEDTRSLHVLPRIIQIVDEAKTILFEVELTQALNDYCAENGPGNTTAACQDRPFPLSIMPPVPGGILFPNPQTPRADRPEATTDLNLIFPSPAVDLCIAKDDETTRLTRMDRLEYCQILPLALACPSLDFEPGAGQFAVNESLDGQLWSVDPLALTVNGESIYTGNGIRLGPDSTLAIAPTGCLLTSVEVSLQPAQQAVTEPQFAQSGGQAEALWSSKEQLAMVGADRRDLLVMVPANGQPAQKAAQESEPVVLLWNLGRTIEDRAPLPLADGTTLRINALPLNNRIQLAVQGGRVTIDRVRVNVAPDLGEEPPADVPIVTPSDTPTANLTPTATSTGVSTRSATRTPTRFATATQTATPTPRATVTPTSTPRATVTPTSTPRATVTPTSTPSPTITPTPQPLCTVVTDALNLRYGPGVIYAPPIGSFTAGTLLTPLGRNAESTWIEVQQRGATARGWVSAGAQYVECNIPIATLPVVPVPPTPTFIPTPTFTPTSTPTPRLDPQLSISPYAGPVGTEYTVAFRSFVPGEIVNVDVQFEQTGQIVFRTAVTMDRAGAGFLSLTSEASDPSGRYAVTARGQSGLVARAFFEIEARPTGQPDLVVALDDFNVDCFSTDNGVACNLTVFFTVSNIGTGDASAPFAVYVEGDAVPAGRSSIRALAAGASQSSSITLGPGGNCYNPDCTINLLVDPDNVIDERNEQNNSDSGTGIG